MPTNVSIRKAVITAAGRGVRLYPAASTVEKAMLPLGDRDGLTKPLIQIIAEEALQSGIEEICLVCAPGDEEGYRKRFALLQQNFREAFQGRDWAEQEVEKLDQLLSALSFVEQEEPLGYGHAVLSAAKWVGSEPFLLLLGDHLYVSRDGRANCAGQLLQVAREEGCSVSSVNPVREHLIRFYGTLTGKRLGGKQGLYEVEKVLEKPSVSRAELELQTAGLRAGYYLCFFGMHVLQPEIFALLEEQAANVDHTDRYGLTPALNRMAAHGRYLALEVNGSRFDISSKFGWLRAQVALGLAGTDREEMLRAITDMLAEEAQASGGSGYRGE